MLWFTNVTQSEAYQKQLAHAKEEGVKPLLLTTWKRIEIPSLILLFCIGIGLIPFFPMVEAVGKSLASFFNTGKMNGILWAMVGFIGLLLLVGVPFILDYFKRAQGTRYGSSKFGYNHAMLSRYNNGLVINGNDARMKDQDSFKHTLLVAPTGSGKTTSYILPNTLILDSSLIISDVKGEIFSNCNGRLKAKGYDIQVLDLSDVSKSLRFNPLLRLKTDQDIKGFAEMLFDISNNGAKTEGIWKQGACSLMAMIISCLKNAPEEHCNMANLIHVIESMNFESGCKELEEFIVKYRPDAETVVRFDRFRRQRESISSGQWSSALACLSAFDTNAMRQLTATDDFDFQSLRKRKTALFLRLPVSRSESYAPFLTVFYAQLFDHLLNTSVEDSDQSIYCLLDEFGNLKAIPGFDEVCSLIRSKRVSLSLVVQNIKQISNAYGSEKATTILANCASTIAFSGIKDKETLEMLQHQIGVSTYTEYDSERGKNIESRRDLMTKDEIRRLNKGELLFLHGNIQPLKLSITPIYENTALMRENGIKSKNGKLVSKYPAVRQAARAEDLIQYIPIEGSFLGQSTSSTSVEPGISPQPTAIEQER